MDARVPDRRPRPTRDWRRSGAGDARVFHRQHDARRLAGRAAGDRLTAAPRAQNGAKLLQT